MTPSEFLLVTGLVVFVVSTGSLIFAKLIAKDAATRDALLFASVCLSLLAPLAIFCADFQRKRARHNIA